MEEINKNEYNMNERIEKLFEMNEKGLDKLDEKEKNNLH